MYDDIEPPEALPEEYKAWQDCEQLRRALRDMVFQFCFVTKQKDGTESVQHSFMSAEEAAFEALGWEYGHILTEDDLKGY